MIGEVDVLRKITSRSENLIQLAEEATELAEEALKLITELMNKDTDNIVGIDFMEEVADVKLCIDIIGDYKIVSSNKRIEILANHTIIEGLINQCLKLTKASLKFRRATDSSASPTPVSAEDAETAFIEAVNNVKTYVDAMGDYWDNDIVNHIYNEKAVRYINRVMK
jgi:hypothetical protein